MNQILSIENNDQKPRKNKHNRRTTSGPVDITTVLKFFSIAVLVFGVFMVGTGSYAMYKNSSSGNANGITKPSLVVETTDEGNLRIKVTHDKEIQKVVYSWNGEENIEIPGNGRRDIEEEIEIPAGSNRLTVTATDVDGQEIMFEKTYESVIEINIEPVETGVKVNVEGKDRLVSMTYKWDDEEEQTIELGDISAEQTIESPEGNHILTVTVTDVNNKRATKKQEVEAVKTPTLEIRPEEVDGEIQFVIEASDERGLSKVEFIIDENTEEKVEFNLEGKTQIKYAYALHDGENKLEAIVYNTMDVSTTQKVKFTK